MRKLLVAVLLSLAAFSASAEGSPPLAAYDGKYPHDRSITPQFLQHPLVQGAVEEVVADTEIRRLVLASNGPKTPIWIEDGRIHSWGCEAHNCGPHNWMVSLRLDGSVPEVCYHNAVSADDGARWYRNGGSEVGDYQCPAGKSED